MVTASSDIPFCDPWVIHSMWREGLITGTHALEKTVGVTEPSLLDRASSGCGDRKTVGFRMGTDSDDECTHALSPERAV